MPLNKDLENHLDKKPPATNKYGRARQEQTLTSILPDNYISKKIGSYQGDQIILFKKDGYIWLYVGSYGSCSVCDLWLGNPSEWIDRFFRETQAFKNKQQLKEYIKEEDLNRQLNRVRGKALEAVESL